MPELRMQPYIIIAVNGKTVCQVLFCMGFIVKIRILRLSDWPSCFLHKNCRVVSSSAIFLGCDTMHFVR
jgi:hypothetical protein